MFTYCSLPDECIGMFQVLFSNHKLYFRCLFMVVIDAPQIAVFGVAGKGRVLASQVQVSVNAIQFAIYVASSGSALTC